MKTNDCESTLCSTNKRRFTLDVLLSRDISLLLPCFLVPTRQTLPEVQFLTAFLFLLSFFQTHTHFKSHLDPDDSTNFILLLDPFLKPRSIFRMYILCTLLLQYLNKFNIPNIKLLMYLLLEKLFYNFI